MYVDNYLQNYMRVFFLIISSLFVGLYLMLVPLPFWLDLVRPDLFTLILLYWIMQESARIGIWVVFFIGIFLDVLYGTPCGLHVLGLVTITYMTLKIYRQLHSFPVWQQAVYIVGLIATYKVVLYTFALLTTGNIDLLKLSLTTVSSLLFWPWIRMIMESFSSKI